MDTYRYSVVTDFGVDGAFVTGVGAWALTVGPLNADTKKLPMTTEAIPTENFRMENRWTVVRLLEPLDFFIEFFPFV